jgi:hypothetical protein
MAQRGSFSYEALQQRVNGNTQPSSFLGKTRFGPA